MAVTLAVREQEFLARSCATIAAMDQLKIKNKPMEDGLETGQPMGAARFSALFMCGPRHAKFIRSKLDVQTQVFIASKT